MRRQEEPYLTGNLTAMIDVVFQLIIFFVCAISMQNNTIDESITLTLAPNGTPIKEKDPREVIIDVHKDFGWFEFLKHPGEPATRLSIARQPYSQALLASVLRKTISDHGGVPDAVPVIIRGDDAVLHESVQMALDACSEAGIVKVKFAALKEKGS